MLNHHSRWSRSSVTNFPKGKWVNGNWLPILESARKRRHSISFVYRSYHLPVPDPSPSALTV